MQSAQPTLAIELAIVDGEHGEDRSSQKPLLSVVVPVYNEATLIADNLARLCVYLGTIESDYRWELVVVNDGSKDASGQLVDAFADGRPNVRVVHHRTNFGLGQAFQSGFHECKGDYIVTLDADLSYSPDHIKRLVDALRRTNSKILVASPYMKGGEISNIPWLRRTLSIWANRFLSLASRGSLSTLTGMVRAYDARFIRGVHLRAQGTEINPEMIYKGMMLRARMGEIPAHLSWPDTAAGQPKRRSSMQVSRQILAVMLSGFLFRPVIFFILPGVLMLLFALYVNGWMFAHFWFHFQSLPEIGSFTSRASVAVAQAYQQAPHTFLVGGLAAMLSIQLIGLGILSLQSKSYFEESFHLGSSMYRLLREHEREQS